ncbi:cell division protein FtsL [Vibrio sp. SCSIO 43136]|uniref:cell division protein FtsL n=1 Tax=Vibrio sp. SCSIO 43136 TaxID=2819101 RepID=UPI00207515BC|nr:cell division protein FtsL [Vibrio sp. SCSIO 43136]USD64871.1 cell division protein FtsL [Vibrio sp. SCSIO 43136]
MDESPQQQNLAKHIALDLITVGRIPALLLGCAFASAMWVVHTTHDTRQAVHALDLTMAERDRLNNEWRNLILEENALSEHSRVQEIASQELEMSRPDGDKEVVISLK